MLMHQRSLPLDVPDARAVYRRAPESRRTEFEQATDWPRVESRFRDAYAGRTLAGLDTFLAKVKAVWYAAWSGHDPVRLGRRLLPIRDLAFVRYDQSRAR